MQILATTKSVFDTCWLTYTSRPETVPSRSRHRVINGRQATLTETWSNSMRSLISPSTATTSLTAPLCVGHVVYRLTNFISSEPLHRNCFTSKWTDNAIEHFFCKHTPSIPVLLRMKNWTVSYMKRFSISQHTRDLYELLKQSGFLAHPVCFRMIFFNILVQETPVVMTDVSCIPADL